MPVTYIDRIDALFACPPAMAWLRTENHPDLATAWAACPHGDWMLWLAGRLVGPPGHPARIPLVLAACDCAELALVRVPVGEERPRRAIEAARAWVRGEATAIEVRMAAADAADAADATPTAADAAASAADAAASATANFVALAASAAASNAATAISATCTYYTAISRCADIVRRYYPTPPMLE